MKKRTSLFLSLFVFFAAGFITARLHPKIAVFFQTPKTSLHFSPSSYPLRNHSFVVVIIGQNNGMHVDKTLRSVLSQNYENFRVIYIDDGSTDGNFLQARDIVYESGKAEKVLLLQNSSPLEEFQNLTQVADRCSGNEILVVVNGEDLLSHEWVLQRLNQYYASPDLWIALGNSLELPNFTRQETSLSCHLRTFYVSLFKEVSESYAIDPEDLSYMGPLMELGKGHSQYLDDILYLVKEHKDPILEENL